MEKATPSPPSTSSENTCADLNAKDGFYPTDPKRLGLEAAIGAGKVDFPEVIRKLHQLHYTGPITIEREISGPRQEADIRASIAYLRRLIDST